jgi:hypothetical protein
MHIQVLSEINVEKIVKPIYRKVLKMGILALAVWQWILLIVGVIILVVAIIMKKKGG